MGKVKQTVYEHELCDPENIGKLIQLDMEFEDTDGYFHPSGSIYKILEIDYLPPMQIPCLVLGDEIGRKCVQTVYDLQDGKWRIIPQGKLTDTLYRKF